MIKKLLQRNSHVSMIAVVLLCALQITACGKEPAQAPVPPKPPVPPPQTAAATPPQIAAVQSKPVQTQASSALRIPPPQVNQYDFSNKKDPLKPFVTAKAGQKNTPEPDTRRKVQRNSLPIHSFDVNQFKLIGIITGGRENQAMVTDPGGKGYVLKVGMSIGKNDGRITSISSSGVDVLEQFKDDNGRVRKERIKLTLPRKQ